MQRVSKLCRVFLETQRLFVRINTENIKNIYRVFLTINTETISNNQYKEYSFAGIYLHKTNLEVLTINTGTISINRESITININYFSELLKIIVKC